ncbi:MAG: sigma-70 family RNA polymerase sigma factor [Candidatus Aenigmarchaeota archaeon]|nr:sigma-70 family RNA polymerase sigma factor [Candidatus Aenigmarchaeota archaeon]
MKILYTRRYIAEISGYPALTKEEQLELGRRKDTGDIEARDRLVKSGLGQVAYYASLFNNNDHQLQEMLSEGTLALFDAVDKYDHTKGCTLDTYSKDRIMKAILGCRSQRVIRISNSIYEAKKRAKSIIEDYLAVTGREPTDEQIALRLGNSYTARRAGRLIRKPDRIDIVGLDGFAEDHGDERLRLISVIPDPKAENPEEALLRGDTKKHVSLIVGRLKPREKEVIGRSLMAEEKESLAAIGYSMGFTREYARQIEAKAKRKLRRYAGARFASPRGHGSPG